MSRPKEGRGRRPVAARAAAAEPAPAAGPRQGRPAAAAAPLPAGGATRQALLAVACVATGSAVRVADGNYHPAAIALVGAALAAALAAVAGVRVAAVERRGRQGVAGVLLAGLAVHAVLLSARRLLPVGGEVDPAAVAAAAAGLVGCFAGAALCAPAALGRPSAAGRPLAAGRPPTAARHLATAGLVVLVLSHVAAAVAAVRAAVPPMDVILFQQWAAAELLDGRNPYAMTFPDPSGGTSPHYGPGLQAGGLLLFGFPYPPLSLWLTAPAAILAGDFRLAHAAAFTLAGLLAALAGRRAPAAVLAAALLLTTPAGPLVMASGWTEPLVAALLALTVYAAGRSPRAAAAPLGLLWAAKQYVPLTAPLAVLLAGSRPGSEPGRGGPGRQTVGRLLVAAAVAAAVVSLPLAAWDVKAFWHSAVAVQFRQPFRPDALSVPAAVHAATGVILPAWVAFAALAAAQALALWRAPRTPAGFAAATGLALLAFFAFSKQAFANYYFLVTAAFAVAAAAASDEAPDPGGGGERSA